MSSILILSICSIIILGSSSAFVPSPEAHFSARTLFGKKVTERSEGDDNTSSTWKTEEDWVLMDKVPKFTVGESMQARTFWTQLSVSTPEFGSRTEDELRERYETLFETNESPLPRAGDSPPILQEWTIDDATGKVSGEYQGRTVWLPSQMVGRLNEDPFASVLELKALPGGFVEAVGGRVYELGQPATKASSVTDSTDIAFQSASNDNIGLGNINGLKMPNLFSTTTDAIGVTSLIATAVLSAAIGFGAASNFANQPQSLPPSNQVQVAVVKSAVKSTPNIVEVKQGEQSISERRARSESIFLRDERILNILREKLKEDKTALQKLRSQEASASAVGDNTEVTRIAEQRARVELRTLREERTIQTISDRLGPEKAKLQELQAIEASQRNLLP